MYKCKSLPIKDGTYIKKNIILFRENAGCMMLPFFFFFDLTDELHVETCNPTIRAIYLLVFM